MNDYPTVLVDELHSATQGLVDDELTTEYYVTRCVNRRPLKSSRMSLFMHVRSPREGRVSGLYSMPAGQQHYLCSVVRR